MKRGVTLLHPMPWLKTLWSPEYKNLSLGMGRYSMGCGSWPGLLNRHFHAGQTVVNEPAETPGGAMQGTGRNSLEVVPDDHGAVF